MGLANLVERDLKAIWHPCSQMKDYETFKPLYAVKAQGSYFYLQDGRKIIDAIASWWCKSLGHRHPRLQKALKRQMAIFEHVPLVNLTHDVIVELSEHLTKLSPQLTKIFYAGDGSCAVEIAMKMSLHARKIRGESYKTKFIALENSYHGETAGALSVSDVGIYRNPYKELLMDVHFVTSLPYINNLTDSLGQDCSLIWDLIEKKG